MKPEDRKGSTLALVLATLGFLFTFYAWSMLGPLSPEFKDQLGLSTLQVAIVIAVPVLMGSIMRIPLGILTDRLGGRKVFIGLLAFTLLPLGALAIWHDSFAALIVIGFFLGFAGASFAIGVPFVKADRLRGLAFTGLKRSDQIPDVPTLDESGLKGYEVSGWYGIYGPPLLPKAITNRLYEAARTVMQHPDTRKTYAEINIESRGTTPAEFAKFLREDLEKYGKIVKVAGIMPQ